MVSNTVKQMTLYTNQTGIWINWMEREQWHCGRPVTGGLVGLMAASMTVDGHRSDRLSLHWCRYESTAVTVSGCRLVPLPTHSLTYRLHKNLTCYNN